MASSLLVLTDFFQPADRALEYAATLAAGLGAHLVLLHVNPDSVLDPDLLTSQQVAPNRDAEKLALASLKRSLPVPTTAETGNGRVADAVAAAVHRHKPTLLVLGRPNTDDLPDELVTTTALELLRAAPGPMLVVPPTVRQAPVPRRVLLAVDGEPFTLGAHAGPMRHLLDTLGAELTVLHVAAQPAPAAIAAATTAAALASVQRTGLLADLTRPVGTRSLLGARPAEAILAAAQPSEYDLVVLIARPRSFWGELFHRSVTAEVLLHSAVPVLVLPAQE